MQWTRILVASATALWCHIPFASAQDTSASVTGISRSFNPAISANALFDAVYADDATHDDADGEAGQGHGHGASDATGLRVQEVELQLSAVEIGRAHV